MQDPNARFAFVDVPPTPPGLSLARRQGRIPYLEADIDGGELFVDPARLLLRCGAVTSAVARDCRLVCVGGNGRVGIGHRAPSRLRPAGTTSLQFVVVEAGASVQLVARAILAATPCPRSLKVRGGHGGELLLVQAPIEDDLLLVLAAGAASYQRLGSGQAVDVAADALLAADSSVDLAAGEHVYAGMRCAFVQCLGPGGIALQHG
jgi:hypothetical protein